ncbi:hypothetical protein ABIA30_001203 [Mycobacterium sp. MAA66]|uniref:DUF732 domain-containing protein n=1 Tax=Mycobacterium sp. MAA66 TaxID=3156297 RepID=UPI0035154D83
MKTTRMASWSLNAAVIAMAVGLAAPPAIADVGTESATDLVFMKALNDKSIHMTNDRAIDLAHGACSELQHGGDLISTLVYIKNNSALSDNDTVIFDGLAIYAYCQQYFPEVRAAAQSAAPQPF